MAETGPHDGDAEALAPLSLGAQAPHLGRSVGPGLPPSQSREDLGRSPGAGGQGSCPQQRKDNGQEGLHLSNGRESPNPWGVQFYVHDKYEKAREA